MSSENRANEPIDDYSRTLAIEQEVGRAVAAFGIYTRNVSLYGTFHPVVESSASAAFESISDVLISVRSTTLAVTDSNLAMGSYLIGDDTGTLRSFAHMLWERKISELKFTAGVTKDEVIRFAEALSMPTADLMLRGGLDTELKRHAVTNISVKSGSLPTESLPGRDPADIYEEALVLIEDAMRAVQAGLQVPVAEIRGLVSDSLESLVADESALLALAGVRSYDRYLSEHSVNVCVLSMVLGRDLGLDATALLDLGVGALLHDVGKVFIPNEIISKTGKLSEEEWTEIRRHPVEGARALAGMKDLPALAPTIALEHHEYCDGTGYPTTGTGQPHLLSRLVAIVDTYDALTTDRPYRDRWTPVQAIAFMLYEAWPRYDRQLLARFASRANLYPIGSLARLKNGKVAAVIGGSHRHPRRPIVNIVTGISGGKPEIIDLSKVHDSNMEIESIAQPVEVLLQYADRLLNNQ